MANYRILQKQGRTVIKSALVNDIGLIRICANSSPNDAAKAIRNRQNAEDGLTVKIKYRGFNFVINRVYAENGDQ